MSRPFFPGGEKGTAGVRAEPEKTRRQKSAVARPNGELAGAGGLRLGWCDRQAMSREALMPERGEGPNPAACLLPDRPPDAHDRSFPVEAIPQIGEDEPRRE